MRRTARLTRLQHFRDGRVSKRSYRQEQINHDEGLLAIMAYTQSNESENGKRNAEGQRLETAPPLLQQRWLRFRLAPL